MALQSLWYVRRGVEIRGPYPARQISRYLLLGRVREGDELSRDQHHWRPLDEFPDLIPEEMKGDLSRPEAQERLRQARIQADERGAQDRREAAEKRVKASGERRRDGRREQEPDDIVKHREARERVLQSTRGHAENYFWRGAMVGGFIVLLGAVAYISLPTREGVRHDCSAKPAPGVNWSNCRMEGAELAGQDLAGARLGNTNLSGANLARAQLPGADLAYANLTSARMTGASLPAANLFGTTLRNAVLSGADLKGANLGYAVLQGIDLSGADLEGANFSNADLTGAVLNEANLRGAIFANAIWPDGQQCSGESVTRCLPVQ
jgi:hypothetical protein